MEAQSTHPQPRPSLSQRFFWFICSIRFTVFLLVSLAAILAVATVIESREGTGAVQMKVYRAAWFNFFLFGFTTNMLGGTYKRFRLLWTHLGFGVTHIGVFTILVGAFLTRNFGFEGQMTIPETTARDYFIGNDDRLQATVGSDSLVMNVPIERGSKSRDVWAAEKLANTGLTVVLDRYFPDLEFDQQVDPATTGADPNPAVQFKINAMGSDASGWLLSRVEGRNTVELGPLQLRLTEGAPPSPVVSGATKTAGQNVLVVTDAEGKNPIEVSATAGQTIDGELAGKPVKITVKQAFSNFTMDGKDFRDREGPPENPAVAFVIEGPAGHFPDIAFAKYPDFSLQHGKTNAPYKAKYLFRGAPAEVEGPGNRLTIYWQAGTLSYGLKIGSKPLQTGDLPIGKQVGLMDGRLQFSAEKAVPNARVTQIPTNGGDEAKNPAIHVKVVPDDGKEGSGVWIPWGEAREVEVAGKKVSLLYRGEKFDLPFSIKLVKFKEDKYPGTNSPATYESKVFLKDPEQGRSEELVISMNEPLLYRGYTFFQSSFIPGENYTTVLSVSHDPGKWPTYIGYILMVLGCILMFYVKPYLAKLDQARMKKEKSR